MSTAKPEPIVNLGDEHNKLVEIEKDIKKFTDEHNAYLEELGLDLLP